MAVPSVDGESCGDVVMTLVMVLVMALVMGIVMMGDGEHGSADEVDAGGVTTDGKDDHDVEGGMHGGNHVSGNACAQCAAAGPIFAHRITDVAC